MTQVAEQVPRYPIADLGLARRLERAEGATNAAFVEARATIAPNTGATQRALLAARLRFAAVRGVPLAMVVALPGSGSQRNVERQGFRVAYTRTKWRLGPGPSGVPPEGTPS